MGSVGFDGEVESQPSTSNRKKYKLPRTLLACCGAVNDASVPRKLRSAIKTRARESIASPLSISKKQRHVSNRVDTLRKDSAKKSKPKRGHVTKDEEEVAETLYALATMFSDTNKSNQPSLNDEPNDTKSLSALEAGSSINAVEDNEIPTQREEPRKISSKVTLDITCRSPNLLDSKAQIVKLQSSGCAKKPKLSSSKQTSSPAGSGFESDFHVAASGAQYGEKYYPTDDKYNGLSQSPLGTQSFERRGCCLRSSTNRLPAWFKSTDLASEPPVIENSISTEKCTRVAAQSNKSWKRSSTQVYISRLVKVLQMSESKEESPEKPTHLVTCGSAYQLTGINGRKSGVAFNGTIDYAAEKDSAEIQNDMSLRKRLIRDWQMASETSTLCSTKEGYDFLSLGTEVCGLDAREGVNRPGQSHEAPKQFHASYMQSQNQPGVLFALPRNGYSSTFHSQNSALAAQQEIQPPQYLSSTSTVNGNFTARLGRQLEMQHQPKWAHQLLARYYTGGVGSPHLTNWKIGKTGSPSMLNDAQTLLPHLLDSKHQQQQQLMSINSSLPLLPSVKIRNEHHFPLGFQSDGATFYSDSITQLQLPCNQYH